MPISNQDRARSARRLAPALAGVLLALALAPATALAASRPAATLSNGAGSVVVVIDSTGFDTTNPAIQDVVTDEVCLDALSGQPGNQVFCPGHVAMAQGPGAAIPQLTSTGTYVFSGSEHGTAVASEVASSAPGAKLIVIRSLFSTNIALQWVVAHASDYNIAAVVLSGGADNVYPSHRDYLPCDQQFESVAGVNSTVLPYVQQLAADNIPFVVAAGNDSDAQYIEWPACVTGVVSVGALDTSTTVAPYSDVSSMLSLLAPGTDNVANEVPFGNYAIQSEQGTSFAAPYVAGVFAMVHASYPTMPFTTELAAMRTSGTLVNDTIVQSIPALNLTSLSTLLASGASIPSLASTMAVQEASAPSANLQTQITSLTAQLGVATTAESADQTRITSLTAQLGVATTAESADQTQITSLISALVRVVAPFDLHVAPEATSAKVSWSALPALTSSISTRYVVLASPGTQLCNSSGASTCVVHGLRAGSTYTFRVRMITPQGESPWSNRSAPIVVR